MERFSVSPMSFFRTVFKNRSLLYALVRRDVVGRYQGSMAGLLWSFFNPLFMLAVYTFFFSVVVKSRWGGGTQSKTEFALVAFVGLIVFNLFVECLTRAPNLIVSNTNYVKKIIFPLGILPLVVVGSVLFHTVVSLIAWVLFYLICFGVPPWTGLVFPIVIVPLVLFVLGISWFLSSLGVYLRDVSQVVTVLTGALMFLSPIFYPVSSMPPRLQIVFHLNPLTPAIEFSRSVLIFGRLPVLAHYFIFLAVGFTVAWGGFCWFQKTRAGFADVL